MRIPDFLVRLLLLAGREKLLSRLHVKILYVSQKACMLGHGEKLRLSTKLRQKTSAIRTDTAERHDIYVILQEQNLLFSHYLTNSNVNSGNFRSEASSFYKFVLYEPIRLFSGFNYSEYRKKLRNYGTCCQKPTDLRGAFTKKNH